MSLYWLSWQICAQWSFIHSKPLGRPWTVGSPHLCSVALGRGQSCCHTLLHLLLPHSAVRFPAVRLTCLFLWRSSFPGLFAQDLGPCHHTPLMLKLLVCHSSTYQSMHPLVTFLLHSRCCIWCRGYWDEEAMVSALKGLDSLMDKAKKACDFLHAHIKFTSYGRFIVNHLIPTPIVQIPSSPPHRLQPINWNASRDMRKSTCRNLGRWHAVDAFWTWGPWQGVSVLSHPNSVPSPGTLAYALLFFLSLICTTMGSSSQAPVLSVLCTSP